jgi:hypothetical protein
MLDHQLKVRKFPTGLNSTLHSNHNRNNLKICTFPIYYGDLFLEGKKQENGGIPLKSKGVGDWYCEEYCYDDGYVYECVTDCYEPWAPQSNCKFCSSVN